MQATKTVLLKWRCAPNFMQETPQAFQRIVPCPACKGDSLYAPRNPYRPFCSARCQGLDLGAWASEAFRMEASNMGNDTEEL